MIKPQLKEFMRRIEKNSVAIIPAAREAVRSHDTNYRYRQNSDFFYLTGFEEPDAIAVIAPSKEKKFTLFVRPRDLEQEIWNGYRAGVEGAVTDYDADEAFPISEFDEKLPEFLDGPEVLYYAFGHTTAEMDQKIIRQLTSMRETNRKPLEPPRTIIDPTSILHEMRVLKSPEEVGIMQRAADIAAEAHVEAMKAVRPGMMEYEVESMLEAYFRKHGASGSSYTSIVGAGGNATVLHYIDNKDELKDGDLLLVDAGAEYKGYASDITRTFPINGKFTPAQRDIYDLVLKCQMSCVDMVRPGVRLEDLKTHSIEILTEGMVELGLLKGDPKKLIEEKKYMQFYMHNLGHYLGIDVHDAGRYYFKGESRAAEVGMVMTIEPGLYISPDTSRIPDGFNKDIPEKYLGIVVPVASVTIDATEIRSYLQDRLPEFMVPAAIVELDALPLTPTMKVNRRALPAPVYDAHAHAGYVAPRTPAEEKLAGIWADVLKVENLGVNDNFFELGGHSLLAARLFARIESAFNKRLPLATLFQAPTVAKLAEIVSTNEWSTEWSSLVAIQPNGSKRPFFCVHAAGGNVVELHELARHLNADQPFYAFQSRGLDGRHEPLTDIREMAAHYISEMRQVQPHGPYLLGGRSFGGVVAFEMAGQLHDENEEVGLVALLDTYPSGHYKLRPEGNTRSFRRQRFARKIRSHVENLRRLSLRDKQAYILDKLQYAPAKMQHRLWRILARASKRLHRQLPKKLRVIQQLNFLAVHNFTPRIYSGGRVSLFVATGDLTAAYDLREGWEILAPRGVDVHEIPGDHINIIKEPHVGALAERLRECLDQVALARACKAA